MGGTIRMGHRTMAGGRIGRRPALAAALIGLVLAGAGLVPAIAADQGSGSDGRPAKAESARVARKKTADSLDRLVVKMAKPGGRDEEEALAASVGGRHGGRIRPGVFRVDVPKGEGRAAARKLRQNRSVAYVEDDVRF